MPVNFSSPPPSAPHDGREARRRQLKAAMVAYGNDDIEPLRTAIEAAREACLDKEDIEPAKELLRKLEEQQKPLTFSDINRIYMEKLQATTSRDEATAILMGCMGVSLDDGFLSEILAELHYQNFAFCQRRRFCAEKASTYLSIMKAVHSAAFVSEKLSKQTAQALFEALLERHSRQLPPYSVGVFSHDEAEAVRRHADRTFFHHYKMYAFVYVHRLELCVQVVEDRTTPEVPTPVPVSLQHEMDPHEVPQLEELFCDPEEAAMASAADAESIQRSSTKPRDSLAADDEQEAGVLAAIDEVLESRLQDLDVQMQLPSI